MTEALITQDTGQQQQAQQTGQTAAQPQAAQAAGAQQQTQTGQAAAQPATAAGQQAAGAQQNLVAGGNGKHDVPEKFRVTRADGTLDHEATLQKALGSYVNLEKRFGSGDIPPETAEGYKLDYAAFPSEVKISPDGEKAFLKSMHSAGLTNKQVQAVLNKYGETLKTGFELQKQQEAGRTKATLDAVASDLRTHWGQKNDDNVKAAIRGFNHLADETDKADLGKIGVDLGATYRILMKVLARVGAGVAEDKLPTQAEMTGINQTLEELRTSKAYLDAADPAHKATVAKVEALYQRKYPKK